MPGAWNQHPQTFPKPVHPQEREAHVGKNGDVMRWILEAQRGLRRRALPHQESFTLTVLPVSPDKAAVLLLLARNECVGVSSLLTTLLSHGLSCRRRAKRHHISKMLEAILSRGKRMQSITPIASTCRPFETDQARQWAQLVKRRGDGNPAQKSSYSVVLPFFKC